MSKSKLITCAEFQLFLDENPDYAPDHWAEPRFPKGDGKKPVLGLTSGAAQAFCNWLSERESNTDWIYRLPELGEAEDSECCWQTLSGVFFLSRPQLIEMPLKDWLIDNQAIPPKLLTISVELNGYRSHRLAVDLDHASASARALDLARASALDLALDLARASARALDLARASARALDLDLARALASANPLDLDLDLDLDRASTLANPLALALDLARPRDLDLDLDLALASAHANTLALDLDSASALANALERDIAINRALELVQKLINELASVYVQSKSGDQDWLQLMDLFLQVAQIIKGYIELALLLNHDDRGYYPVHLLQKQGKVEDYRRNILQAAVEQYEDQPNKLLNSPEWKKWQYDLNDLLQGYATLVMYEKRRTGEWQPFEGLRIVKARRVHKK